MPNDAPVDELAGMSIKDKLLYKMDRTIALAGIICIGAYALHIGTADAMQVTSLAMGALAGYLGGRTGK